MNGSNTALNAPGITVIITGANGNLGSIVTSVFLSKGYKVIATLHNDAAKKDLPAHDHLKIVAVDLTDETATATFIKSSIAEYGRIDAVLLLAGGFAMGKIAETAMEDIRKQIALNFETAYHIVYALFPHMLENNNGRIVFIGSRPALEAKDGRNMIAYGLSKSLLFKLAEYINAEAKGKNVTATVVVPSTLDTPPNRNSMPDADPKNWVKPEDLAAILEFIISEKAATLRESVLKVYNNS